MVRRDDENEPVRYRLHSWSCNSRPGTQGREGSRNLYAALSWHPREDEFPIDQSRPGGDRIPRTLTTLCRLHDRIWIIGARPVFAMIVPTSR